ncbi:MAG: acyl carrier protein [Legionella sp.]|nr:acyl carrier protein [Legionella sp.]
MLVSRIQSTLKNAGFFEVPDDKDANLIDLGLDSLFLALWIIELEQEFKLKIPVIPLVKERFESIAAIENYLIELGVK